MDRIFDHKKSPLSANDGIFCITTPRGAMGKCVRLFLRWFLNKTFIMIHQLWLPVQKLQIEAELDAANEPEHRNNVSIFLFSSSKGRQHRYIMTKWLVNVNMHHYLLCWFLFAFCECNCIAMFLLSVQRATPICS